MKKWLLSGSLGLALAYGGIPSAQAQDEHFDIQKFDVTGNTLLSEAQVRSLLDPITGKHKVYGDVQKALEALEGAYRAAGYTTVQVEVPEQELTSGIVHLHVVEVVIGQVNVVNNKYFDTENIKAGLPALRPGQAPNLRHLSENVQLSNENPAKKVEVTLGVGEKDDTVDVKVNVTDNDPHRFSLSVDNTGAPSSGQWRTGFSYQYANLFDRDHTASIAYTTSPDSPEGVKINQFSIGYRLPLYSIGDSVDMIFGKSSSNTPSSTPLLGGALNIVGKGDVAGLHFNHSFARQGETTSKLVTGLDYKYIDSRCAAAFNGEPVSIAPPTPPIASCVPFTLTPLSFTYSSSTRAAGAQVDYSLGLSVNIASGTKYTNITGRVDRYSYLTPGNRDTPDNFAIMRGGASYLTGFENDMQVRVAMSGQYAFNPALSAEQFGMGGSNSVRGLAERAVSADSGVLLNAEVYSPDIAQMMKWGANNIRLIAFYDAAYGSNRMAGTVLPPHVSVASFGFGVRAGFGKDVSLRADVARVINAGTSISDKSGDVRAHVSMMFGF